MPLDIHTHTYVPDLEFTQLHSVCVGQTVQLPDRGGEKGGEGRRRGRRDERGGKQIRRKTRGGEKKGVVGWRENEGSGQERGRKEWEKKV